MLRQTFVRRKARETVPEVSSVSCFVIDTVIDKLDFGQHYRIASLFTIAATVKIYDRWDPNTGLYISTLMEFFYIFRSIKFLIFFCVPFPLFYVRKSEMLE